MTASVSRLRYYNGLLIHYKSPGRQQLDALNYRLEELGTPTKADYEPKVRALVDDWVLGRILANRTDRCFRLRSLAEFEAAWQEVQFWPSGARREADHARAEVFREAAFRLMTWRDYVSRFHYAGIGHVWKTGLVPGRPF